MALRLANSGWLGEWEATSPQPSRQPAPTFASYVRSLSAQARAGLVLPFAIEVDGELVGQLTVSSITQGSLRSAAIGYWVAERAAGRGIVPTGVALAVDHCFADRGLHRIEVNIRPENGPSLRVAEKLGLRDEGVRKRYLHINGRWCDHRSFAVTVDEVPDGLLARWRAGWVVAT
jgi:ribosomal-protein-alanine N-acetyltransferase